MKKSLLTVAGILLLSFSLFSQHQAAKGMQSSKGNFTSLGSRPVAHVSDELLASGKDKKHPEYGVLPLNAPCKDCYEVMEKRTETTRYFVINGSKGNTFINQKSLGAINYKDKNGYYLEKDVDVYPTQQPGVFSSNHQEEPVSIDLNAGSMFITDEHGVNIKMNTDLELWGIDKDGNETLISTANWAGATVGSSGLRVNDLFKGITLEAFALSGSVKTNFIMEGYSSSYNTYKWLAIKDRISTDVLNSINFAGTKDVSGLYNCDANIVSHANVSIATIQQGTIYDHSRANSSALYYKYEDGKFAMYVAVDYLKNNATVYPVTIDPLISTSGTLAQAAITGSQQDAVTCTFVNSCDFPLTMNSPANATITDVTFSMSYRALGVCYEEDGAMRVGYKTCVSPSAVGYYYFCNNAVAGTCNGTNISIFSDISGCIPTPSCTPYPMTFVLKMFRDCYGSAGCSAGCIQANSPFVVNVYGKTLETLSNTATGSGTATQAAACTGTVTLNPTPANGVGPFTYAWNPGGATTPAYTATVSTTQTITCNVTDACGTVRTATFTVNPNPSTASAAALPTKTLTACAATVTFSPTYSSSSPITTYAWSGPGISGASNGANVVVNQAGTYIVTFTNSAGCTGNNTYTAVNGPSATTASAVSSTINCTNPTATISPIYAPTSNLTFTWVPVGPGTIVGSANNPSVVLSQPGVYQVTTTNTVSGCQNSFTYTVTNATQTPTISSIGAQNITCTATAVGLNPTYSPSSGLTYSWSGPGLTSTSASVSVNQGGTYTVVATAANGCTSTAQYSVVDNSALPTVTVSGSALTCSGPATLNATPNPGSGTYTYTWTGPGVASGANTSAANVNAAGIYTVNITNAYGCNASGTFSVTGNTNIPTASAVSATINCINTTATLAPVYTPASDLTYTWTTSGTGAITGSTSGPSIIAGQPGVYQVSITNTITNCQSSNTYTVVNATQTPTISSIGTQTISCTAPTATINPLYSPTTGLTYSWSGPGLTATSASVAVTQGGLFTVIATNAATGCTATAQYSVVAQTATPTVSISGGTLTCSGPVTLSTTVNPGSGIYTYTWTGSGIVSGANSSTVNVNAATVYTVGITNNFGCGSTAVFTVVTNANIPTASSVNASITCLNPTATLSPVYNPSTGLTYSWTTTGGAISGSHTGASVVVSQAGVYQVTMTNPSTNCQSSNTYTVTNNTQAPLISTLAPQNITCANPSINISPSYTPATGVTYNWSGPGTSAVTSGITVSQSGTYTVVATAANGCTATAQYVVTGSATAVSAIPQNTVLPCNPDPVSLNVAITPTGTYTYLWNGPGIVSGNNSATPSVNAPGNYTVLVTDANGCNTSAVVNVISPAVTAAFTPTLSSGSAPFVVNFTNNSTGGTSFQWIFGDGNTSVSENPSNTYQAAGSYTVSLMASNGTCSVTAYGVVTVEDDISMLEVPNVFTPNGDHVNDVFIVSTKGIKDLELTIYNRWGEKLYSGSGINASWNGANNGKTVAEGTYFYIVKATGNDGTAYDKKGSVNLFR